VGACEEVGEGGLGTGLCAGSSREGSDVLKARGSLGAKPDPDQWED